MENIYNSASVASYSTNKVLRNTYWLLGLTMAFSAITAIIAMSTGAPHPGPIITLIAFYGLSFMIHRNQHNTTGLVLTFALTGFMGYTLGPILNAYLGAGMGDVVALALGGTGLTFFAMSAYALTTKRDLSFLGGFMLAGFVFLLVGVVANIFLQMPMLSLALSGLFIMFSSCSILLQTQSIVRGGETSYISATVTLYVSIYNIFISLLQLLGVLRD